MKEAEPRSMFLVEYRFDGVEKSQIIPLSLIQYENFRKLPVISECRIVRKDGPTLSKKDIEFMNKKLEKVFAQSKSHTQSLSQ